MTKGYTSYNLSLGGCDDDIEGYMALTISILAHVSPDEAFKRLDSCWNAKSRKWSRKNVEKICQMRENGAEWDQIGKIMNRSPGYVRKKYIQMCSLYNIRPALK